MRRTGRRTHGRLAVFGRGFGAEAHRLLLPQAVHGLGGIVADFFAGTLAQRLQIGLAVTGFDQDLEQHPVRQLTLGRTRRQHPGDVADVMQPLAGLAAGAMGQPELLAGGIGQALITTAAGLSVAIPALIAYMFFTSRVDKLIIEIDALGQEVVQAIAADGIPRRRRAA